MYKGFGGGRQRPRAPVANGPGSHADFTAVGCWGASCRVSEGGRPERRVSMELGGAAVEGSLSASCNCPQRLVSASPGPARAGENHRLPARALLRCRPSDRTYCRECPPPRSSPGGMTTDVFGLKSFSLLPLSLRR